MINYHCLKWQFARKTSFHQRIDQFLLSSKTYFDKISASAIQCTKSYIPYTILESLEYNSLSFYPIKIQYGTRMDILQGPSLIRYSFELSKTWPNLWQKEVLGANYLKLQPKIRLSYVSFQNQAEFFCKNIICDHEGDSSQYSPLFRWG